ncbi:MAG: hypothetical protein IPL46_01160 [Saprospiraceae bacterium]|nr:hypothetical protein [Saprospiraceae bacterium]
MRTILILISLISITTISLAQGQRPPRPEPPSEEMIKKATEELSLTEAQVQQWKEIHVKYNPSREDRSKVVGIREEMEKELEATLTEVQRQKFREMREHEGPAQGHNSRKPK